MNKIQITEKQFNQLKYEYPYEKDTINDLVETEYAYNEVTGEYATVYKFLKEDEIADNIYVICRCMDEFTFIDNMTRQTKNRFNICRLEYRNWEGYWEMNQYNEDGTIAQIDYSTGFNQVYCYLESGEIDFITRNAKIVYKKIK